MSRSSPKIASKPAKKLSQPTEKLSSRATGSSAQRRIFIQMLKDWNSLNEASSFNLVMKAGSGLGIISARPDALQEYIDADPTLMYLTKTYTIAPAAVMEVVTEMLRSEAIPAREAFGDARYIDMLKKYNESHWPAFKHYGTTGVSIDEWKKAHRAILKPKVESIAMKKVVKKKTPAAKKTMEQKLIDKYIEIAAMPLNAEGLSPKTINVSEFPTKMKFQNRAKTARLIKNVDGTYLASSDSAGTAAAMKVLRGAGLLKERRTPVMRAKTPVMAPRDWDDSEEESS